MTLLTDIASDKTAYQTYSIQHGIERLTVLVPLEEAVSFEHRFQSVRTSIPQIRKLVADLGGKVR